MNRITGLKAYLAATTSRTAIIIAAHEDSKITIPWKPQIR